MEQKGKCPANCIIYAPIMFQKMREAYQVDEEKLMSSLEPSNIILNKDPKSDSGETDLFLTEDGLFSLKKINRNAKKHLIDKFLQNYHYHLSKNELETFLTPLLALYSFQLCASTNVSLILWKNMVFNQQENSLHTVFTISNIEVKKESYSDSSDGRPTSKENFLIDNPPSERSLWLKDKEKNKLLDTLGRDINFLISNGVQKYCVKIIFYKKVEKTKRSKIAINKAVSMPVTRDDGPTPSNNNNKRRSNDDIEVVCEIEEEEKNQSEFKQNLVNNNATNLRTQSENVRISEFCVNAKTNTNELYCTIEISNFEYSQNEEEDKKAKKKKAKGSFFSISNPDCYAKTLLDCVEKII